MEKCLVDVQASTALVLDAPVAQDLVVKGRVVVGCVVMVHHPKHRTDTWTQSVLCLIFP
jgi:hypothetical protein